MGCCWRTTHRTLTIALHDDNSCSTLSARARKPKPNPRGQIATTLPVVPPRWALSRPHISDSGSLVSRPGADDSHHPTHKNRNRIRLKTATLTSTTSRTKSLLPGATHLTLLLRPLLHVLSASHLLAIATLWHAFAPLCPRRQRALRLRHVLLLVAATGAPTLGRIGRAMRLLAHTIDALRQLIAAARLLGGRLIQPVALTRSGALRAVGAAATVTAPRPRGARIAAATASVAAAAAGFGGFAASAAAIATVGISAVAIAFLLFGAVLLVQALSQQIQSGQRLHCVRVRIVERRSRIVGLIGTDTSDVVQRKGGLVR